MAESSGFFDAQESIDGSWDRTYIAEQLARYFSMFVGNGVFGTPTNQLKVNSDSGMNVKLLKGYCFINGYWYYNDTDKTITVPSNTNTRDRIDGVFIGLDLSSRQISSYIAQGRIEPTRTSSTYELRVATITVKAGATSIQQSAISDDRLNSSVCGIVTGLIEIVKTNDLFNQFTTMFEEWFVNIKNKLGSDAAGNLQNQINQINSNMQQKIGYGYTLPENPSDGDIFILLEE